MNEYDSDKMADLLRGEGFRDHDQLKCGPDPVQHLLVRERAQEKVFHDLGA